MVTMRSRLLLIGFLLMPIGLAGCQTLLQLAALRQVSFDIDDVDHVRLAGVRLDHLQSPQQLSPDAFARIGAAFATGQMPLEFVMHIGAENPPENQVAARLVRMDWTLLLDDIETISGIFEDERLIAPGAREVLALSMELDLMRFFEHNLQRLVNLGLAMGGHGRQEVALRFRPTVTTALGPITYPGHITIRHTIGG
jgi:hypothetical protein